MDAFGRFMFPVMTGTPVPTMLYQAGRMFTVSSSPGAAVTLPAGGTWLQWTFGGVLSTGLVQQPPVMGIDPGGTQIRAGIVLVNWMGWAWRIS